MTTGIISEPVAPARRKDPAGIDVLAFHGWPNNLRLSNGNVELIVTLDVGPRILAYRKTGGFNPLNIFPEQSGMTGEPAWRNRGGHRLWIAPEHPVHTYHPDNAPVEWDQTDELQVRLTPPAEEGTGLQKQIDLSLDPTGTRVRIVHRVIRLGATPAHLSLWALTVMAAGGMAIIPQPEMGTHPRDLLPDRNLVLWPYTDLSDSRWIFGRKYFRLRQEKGGAPTKVGFNHQPGWCGYLVGGVFFLKRYEWNPLAVYPDNGCNLEIFSNGRMVELESLGPLVHLHPKQAVEHMEEWELHDAPAGLGLSSEATLDQWLQPVLKSNSVQA